MARVALDSFRMYSEGRIIYNLGTSRSQSFSSQGKILHAFPRKIRPHCVAMVHRFENDRHLLNPTSTCCLSRNSEVASSRCLWKTTFSRRQTRNLVIAQASNDDEISENIEPDKDEKKEEEQADIEEEYLELRGELEEGGSGGEEILNKEETEDEAEVDWSEDGNEGEDRLDSSFSEVELETLRRRIDRASSSEAELPLILWDAIVPRQRLQFTIDPGDTENLAMIQAALQGSRTFAMLGIDPLSQVPLRHGCEVEITGALEREGSGGAVDIEVVGRRLLMLQQEPHICPGGYTRGRVIFKDLNSENSAAEQSSEVLEYIQPEDQESADDYANRGVTEESMLSGDQLLLLSQELEDLVEVWTSLVRSGGHERFPSQLQDLFRDLGPMPPAEDYNDRALWVAALINPLPALGVAYEIRPAVLTAQTTVARLKVALAGIKSSIAHLDGTKPLF